MGLFFLLAWASLALLTFSMVWHNTIAEKRIEVTKNGEHSGAFFHARAMASYTPQGSLDVDFSSNGGKYPLNAKGEFRAIYHYICYDGHHCWNMRIYHFH